MFAIALLTLLTHAPQRNAKVIRITHQNIGVYESTLDARRLSQRERLMVVRSIEQYYRPRHTQPLQQWQADAITRHHNHMCELYDQMRTTGRISDRLGWFDDWARDVRLWGVDIQNCARPE